MKWINELEKIKSPDPKITGKDNLNDFLCDVKPHTDKSDKTPTTEKRENERTGYPIPTDENEFARDERQAIIEFDGGGQGVPYIGPVAVKTNSKILATVDVHPEPDQAVVGGVKYSKVELADLLSRKISHDDLLTVHRAKQEFEGAVVPNNHKEMKNDKF